MVGGNLHVAAGLAPGSGSSMVRSDGPASATAAPSSDQPTRARFERLLQDAGHPSHKTPAGNGEGGSEVTARSSTAAGPSQAGAIAGLADASEASAPSETEPLAEAGTVVGNEATLTDAQLMGWPAVAMGVPGNSPASPNGVPSSALLSSGTLSTTVSAPTDAAPLVLPPAATMATPGSAAAEPVAGQPGAGNAGAGLVPQASPASASASASAGAAGAQAIVANPATALPPAASEVAVLPLPPSFESLLRRQGAESESPQPFALASASNPAGAALGLARPSVVNPMEAPSANLHGEDFAETLGSRLTWMAEQKLGHAVVRINPAELGAVDIRIRLEGDRVHAEFNSSQSEVRQVLESSLPRLRELLASQGFSLGQADVGDHGQSRPSAGRSDGIARSEGGGIMEPEALAAPSTRMASRSLLDTYA